MIETRAGAGMVVATVLRLLRDHGRPLFEADLIDAFRGRVEPDELRRALTVMRSTGLVTQPAPDWWCLP